MFASLIGRRVVVSAPVAIPAENYVGGFNVVCCISFLSREEHLLFG